MKCPYKHKQECKQVDTSGVTMLKECKDCDWYSNGVRETGAIVGFDEFLKLFGYGKRQSNI